jgi:GTP-dependent phosphoenolpyruvate carboxykinase
MPRGVASPPGTITVNANGYSQTKTEDRGWVATHTLILERKLGRRLISGERAVFVDGDRANLKPSNIELAQSSNAKTLQSRINRWKAEINDRQEWIKLAEEELARK